ncbi:formate hydrogenlyase subunit 4 [Escherichia coli]|nr:formate hydrogenlyase subunit 4 [Escherichia coli]
MPVPPTSATSPTPFYHWPLSQSIPLVLALCACAFATFIEMGKLPFDLAEAEQELQEGPLSEYKRQRLWRHEMGYQPETAGGVADVRPGCLFRGDKWKPSPPVDCCWRW